MIRLASVLPFVALAACNSGPTVTATNASGQEVADKVAASGAAGFDLTPGRWEGRMAISEVSMPGAPPGVAEQIKTQMSGAEPFATCLTPEEARKPKEKFFAGAGESSCTYKSFTMGGGTIDAVMQCPKGASTKLHGTYAATSYTMEVDTTAPQMSMKMKMDAKHVGPCTGTEKNS